MHSTTRSTRSLAVGLGALALAAALAACGSAGSSGSVGSGHDDHQMPMGASTSTGQSGAHNAADVSFATTMVPHHEQAVAMADLATTRASTDGVRQLAAQVAAAQQPEIATMSGWLAAWGAPVPSGTASAMAGHDMGDMAGASGSGSMPGMMSAQEMTDLAAASGPAFDRMWLQLMVRHHEGAVAMARTEQAQGVSAPAKALAGSIASSQTAEIERMQGLLSALPS